MRITIEVPPLPRNKGCGPGCLCGSSAPLCSAQQRAQVAFLRWQREVIKATIAVLTDLTGNPCAPRR
jgi:hypothetical protein